MKTIGILLLLCASADAQALWFKSNSLDWQMVAQSTTGIYEDGPLVADDATAASHNPATGFGHTTGLVSTNSMHTAAYWNNADGLHHGEVTRAEGWVLSNRHNNVLFKDSLITAGMNNRFSAEMPGTAPKTVSVHLRLLSGSYINRSYAVDDVNRGIAQLIKATITLKGHPIINAGNKPSDLSCVMHGSLNDTYVTATYDWDANNNQGGWTIVRKLRNSSGAWENAAPPHITTTYSGKNMNVSFVTYGMTTTPEGSVFTTQANVNDGEFGEFFQKNGLINGVSGADPSISEEFFPEATVNVNEVTKAF